MFGEHFDIVQIPYYLQMLRAALVIVVQSLRIHQAKSLGMAVSPLRKTLFARVLVIADMAFLFFGMMAVGVSAGSDPVIPRDEVLMTIRLAFTLSALSGITAEGLLMATMTRTKHRGWHG